MVILVSNIQHHQHSILYFRISWDIRQINNKHCVRFFLLKYWHSEGFVPKYTTLKFVASDQRKTYEGSLEVKPCTKYSYVLTMAFIGSKTVDIQGGKC